MIPAASRILRDGRFRWSAWALVPDGGPWFLVGRYWFRWSAQSDLRTFRRRVEAA